MHIELATAAGAALIALAIFAHAWVQRISAPPPVVNFVGWVVAGLTAVIILGGFVRC